MQETNIAIFAETAPFFGASHLAEYMNCSLYVMNEEHNGFLGDKKNIIKYKDKFSCEHLIIIGSRPMMKIVDKIENKRFKSICVILSDSEFCRGYEKYNDFIIKHNLPLYAMPDLQPFISTKFIPAFPTVHIENKETNKSNDKLIIAHSPSSVVKQKVKGTIQINEIIEELKKEYEFDYHLISNKSHTETIEAKRNCHIFIDQMIYKNSHVSQKRWGEKIIYNGGLGKSGIEAMLLGACTITGGVEFPTDEYFPTPPVIYTDYYNFKKQLVELITNKEKRELIASQQKQWANKYASLEFVTKHITRHIT